MRNQNILAKLFCVRDSSGILYGFDKKSHKDIANSPTRSFYGGTRLNPDFNKIEIRYGILVFVCKFAHSIF
jgi:hypothetical protein